MMQFEFSHVEKSTSGTRFAAVFSLVRKNNYGSISEVVCKVSSPFEFLTADSAELAADTVLDFYHLTGCFDQQIMVFDTDAPHVADYPVSENPDINDWRAEK